MVKAWLVVRKSSFRLHVLHIGSSVFVIEQHVNVVCVCSGDGVEVKKEVEQMEMETGEWNVQGMQEHCCVTD
jgi:hypothetical protein